MGDPPRPGGETLKQDLRGSVSDMRREGVVCAGDCDVRLEGPWVLLGPRFLGARRAWCASVAAGSARTQA